MTPIARQEALGYNKQNQVVAWALCMVFNGDCSEQISIEAASCCDKAKTQKRPKLMVHATQSIEGLQTIGKACKVQLKQGVCLEYKILVPAYLALELPGHPPPLGPKWLSELPAPHSHPLG